MKITPRAGHLLGAVCTTWILTCAAPAAAVDLNDRVQFQIPAGRLSEALIHFSKQAHVQVLTSGERASSVTTDGISGTYTLQDALNRLLKDSGLQFKVMTDSAIAVSGADMQTISQATTVGGGRSLRLAQVSEGSAAPQGEQNFTLEEIFVTAQKRDERLQDVPQSVTVLSADTLSRSGATQLRDFAATVPGLSIATSGAGYSQITLRGVTAGVDIGQTVGIYVDDVPFGSSAGFNAASQHTLDVALFDVQRIEVLRGPQGTLYGASTMGGLIKYVTPTPDTSAFSVETQAGLAGTHGGGTSYSGSLVANAPLSTDRAALRASAFFSRDGGFVDNVALGEKDVNNADFYGGRLDLLLTPTADLGIRLTAFQQQIDREGESTGDYDFSGVPLSGELEQIRLFHEPFEQRFRVLSATVDYDFAVAKLTSIGSYQTTELNYVQDLSPLYVPLLGSVGLDFSAVGAESVVAIDKFTQELRLASNGSHRHEWLVGAYYTREESDFGQGLLLRDASGASVANTVHDTFNPTVFEELAVFGDVTWKLTERFDVATGLRYARNEQQFTQFGEGLLGLSAPRRDSSEDVVTYLVNARYHFDERGMLYGRVASGYRPGGPNVISLDITTGSQIAPSTFDADELTSYEVGYKFAAADGRINVDLGVYYIDWEDIHVSVANGGFSAIGNARGGAAIRGGELAVSLRPLDDLIISGALAFTDTEMSEDEPGSGAARGESLPNVPDLAASLAIDYTFAGLRFAPKIGATVQYVDDRMASFDAAPVYLQYALDSYTTVNLRAGLDIHPVEVQLYARNVFDEHGELSAFNWRGTAMPALLQPRTIGVNLLTRF